MPRAQYGAETHRQRRGRVWADLHLVSYVIRCALASCSTTANDIESTHNAVSHTVVVGGYNHVMVQYTPGAHSHCDMAVAAYRRLLSRIHDFLFFRFPAFPCFFWNEQLVAELAIDRAKLCPLENR